LVRNERLEPSTLASGLGAASRVLLIVMEGPAIKE
jgi:hypothetical protein